MPGEPAGSTAFAGAASPPSPVAGAPAADSNAFGSFRYEA